MNLRFSLGSAAFGLALGGLVLGASSCRKPKGEVSVAPPKVVTIAPELDSNNLSAIPSAVYRTQAASPIHWQPWTKETLERAKAANRMVFAVVAMPQQPSFQGVLASLAKDQALVSTINNTYVPVLIDGDASREIGLLTSDLCAEIRRGIQMPLLLWMSPEGNPVAWIPAPNAGSEIAELFNQSHVLVSGSWQNSPDYVLKNSALDNVGRRMRIAERKNAKVMSSQPGDDAVRSVRQLASLYDPYSRAFDEVGGLFPAGALELLSTAAVHPGLPPEVRARCLETTRDLLKDLLPSAMFDPLEGGLFCARSGPSWSLPSFDRDSITQSRGAVALLDAARATGDPLASARALGLIAFAEKNYQTSEGLFSLGLSEETNKAHWLWSVEEIEKELPPADAAMWIKATGMKGLGNLPSEVDPRREHFRSNSLGLAKSIADLAAENSQSVEEFSQRFDAVRKTLLKARTARSGQASKDDTSHAGATFRMVSAYASAFGVTGDPKYREKAVALLEKSREAFSSGPKLRLFTKDAPPSIGEGRAFLYGLAIQSAIDVSAITSDNKWVLWSEDLATTAAELFTGADFLKECPDDARIIDLPVTDLVMLFDDSTAGLVSFAECRLAERERPLVASFSQLATPLPTYAMDRPILHTDLLQATIAREFSAVIVAGEGLPADLKLAAERLPMRMFQRRPAKSEDEVPAGAVKIIYGSGEHRVVSTASALQEAVLPSVTKS